MLRTKVVNKYYLSANWQKDENYVYVGRPSLFGNSHTIHGRCALCSTTHKRGEAVQAFFSDFYDRLTEDDVFREEVHSLRGKTLVCFCVSKQYMEAEDISSFPIVCHAQVIKEYLDSMGE
jgi:hypothetical protein